MKTIILFLLFILIGEVGSAKIWTITNSGFSFNPSTITINLGDTVVFSIADIHSVREVSQTEWNANGNNALPGGFETPSGGGTVMPSQLGLGTHYYVCVPHAASGMKGKIIVQSVTGINLNKFEGGIDVFPNPVYDKVTVHAQNNSIDLNYSIMSLSGKQVLSGKLNDEYSSIDISELQAGIYILRIGKQYFQSFKLFKD